MSLPLGGEDRTVAADTGIDDNEMDGTGGKIMIAGLQSQGGGEDIPGRNGVGDIHQGCRWAPCKHSAFELPNVGIRQAEISG